jgi:predicted CoA-binding protein
MMKNIEELLKKAKTIAVVGLSPNPDRPSGKIAEYLMSRGYTIIPVNPRYEEMMGMKSYASLLDIPEGVRVDIVDVFRKGEDTPPIAREAVKIHASCLWLQLGITNEESGDIAREAGLDFVQDKCIKIEHQRLIG